MNSRLPLIFAITVSIFLAVLLEGCSGCGDAKSDGEDAAHPADAAQDGSHPADEDADSDSDSDADSDSDSDSDADTDTDADSDTDSDVDCTTQWCPPSGCKNMYKYATYSAHRFSWNEQYMSWIVDDSHDEIFIYDVNNDIIQIKYEADDLLVQLVSIADDEIYWRQKVSLPDGGKSYESDVYVCNLSSCNARRVTNNDVTEHCFAIEKGVLLCLYMSSSNQKEVRLLYADAGESKLLSDNPLDQVGSPDAKDKMILFYDDDGTGYSKIMLYDEADGGAPWTITDDPTYDEYMAVFGENKIYFSRVKKGVGNELDIWSYDMNTKSRSPVINDPGQQFGPEVDGYIMAYHDAEMNNTYQPNKIRLYDTDTKARRTMTPVMAEQYLFGVHGKYLSLVYGWNVYLCDLEEGGFIDSEGHVIPDNTDAGI